MGKRGFLSTGALDMWGPITLHLGGLPCVGYPTEYPWPLSWPSALQGNLMSPDTAAASGEQNEP